MGFLIFIAIIVIIIVMANNADKKRIEKLNLQKSMNNIEKSELEKSKKEFTRENKIDILIKIGIGMIILSMFIFSYSNWNELDGIVKALVVMGVASLFFIASIFTENTLKLLKSAESYKVISAVLVPIAYSILAYENVFGKWFVQEGYNLFIFTLCMMSMSLIFLLYKKYIRNSYMLIAYHLLLIGVYNLLIYLTIDITTIFVIFLSTFIIQNYFELNKNKYIVKFNYGYIIAITVLYPVMIMVNNLEFDMLSGFLIILNILNLIYLFIKFKLEGPVSLLIFVFISNIIAFLMVLGIVDQFIIIMIISVIITTIYSLIIIFKYMSYKKEHKTSIPIIINTMYIFVLIIHTSIFKLNNTESLLLSITFIVPYLLAMVIKEENNLIEKVLIPFKIVLLMLILNQTILFIDNNIIITLCILIPIIFAYFENIIDVKKYYLILSFIALVIFAFSINLSVNNFIFILVPVLLAYLLKSKLEVEEYDLITVLSLFTMIYSVYAIVIVNIFELESIISKFISIIGLLTISTFSRKHKITFNSGIYISFLLLIALIMDFKLDYIYNVILIHAILNLAVLYTLKFIKKVEDRDVYLSTFLGLLLLIVLFNVDIIISLYSFIYSFILIAIAYNTKYTTLFKLGVVAVVLNIIINFWEFWTSIPFWVYLLIGGVGIIGFVTYKESKKLDK